MVVMHKWCLLLNLVPKNLEQRGMKVEGMELKGVT